jgi:shikimate kinase/3-dehydroquinate synthase
LENQLTHSRRIFLYGPPGSGKTSIGRSLASELDLPFVDLDAEIEIGCGRSIPQIFIEDGEDGFRRLEKAVLEKILGNDAEIVIALGGGSLLDRGSRLLVEESGTVICLQASLEQLAGRLRIASNQRPLLQGDLDIRLAGLLAKRADHYASFADQLDAAGASPADLAWQIQVRLGRFRVTGMGAEYPVSVQSGGLDEIGTQLKETGLEGPIALVSDATVAPLYAEQAWRSITAAGYAGGMVVIPAGEAAKTLDTAAYLWKNFLQLGLERGSTVVALGGGVVTDLAGFAAATYLRGLSWAAVPTSLLGMVDASLGGKTGLDLPEGKNLVGTFHAPRFVWTDPNVLQSLPIGELRSGMAEVVKAGIIGDADLFQLCACGLPQNFQDWTRLVARAVAVKVRIIRQDPFERGVRAALNLGHTIGHGLELASAFSLRHGEAVAIGTVLETRLAEETGLAEEGLSRRIAAVLSGLGLPVEIPVGLPIDKVMAAMAHDKKKASGRLRFALPAQIGDVRTGVVIERGLVETILGSPISS